MSSVTGSGYQVGSQHMYGDMEVIRVGDQKADPNADPRYLELLQCVLDAYEYRKSFEGFWETVDRAYRMTEYEPHKVNTQDLWEVTPGRVYRFVHTVESTLISNNVKMYLEGYSPTIPDELVAKIEEMLHLETKAETQYYRETRLVIRDAVKYGYGCMMSYFDADFEKIEKRINKEIRNFTTSVENAQIPEESSKPVTYEMDTRLVRERICRKRISPWHILIDPCATAPEDARYIIRMVFAPLDAVKKDPTLSNTEDLKPTPRQRYFDMMKRIKKDEGRTIVGEGPQMVLLYEVWTMQIDGTWDLEVIADGNAHAGVLRKETSPYWVKHPFRFLRWNDDGDTFYCQSDFLSVWTELLAERLLLTKVMDGYARQAEDVTLYDKNCLTSPEKIQEFEHPGIGKMIGVEVPPNKVIQQVFHNMTKDTKSPEVLNLLAVFERSINASSGVSANQLGQALKSGTTASEANNIAAYSSASQAHKQSAVELFLADCAKQWIGLAAQFYGVEQITRIGGTPTAELWASVQWTEALVNEAFRVCVHPGSTRPLNHETRLQQGMAVLQLALQNPQLGTVINLDYILRQILRGMGYHTSSGVLLENAPETLAQIQAMIALLQAGGQGGGGSAPQGPVTPSGDAGAAQVAQGTGL